MIKEVETLKELHDLYEFVYNIYIKEGYCPSNLEGLCIHHPLLDVLPQTTIFVDIVDNKIVGTNALTLNSNFGLHVDKDFPVEVEKVKKECAEKNKILASSWRIVTNDGVKIIHDLILATINKAFSQNVDVCLFSFNPKHEGFYKKLLNLVTISSVVESKAVNNAPAILMRGDKADLLNSRFLTRVR